MRIAVVTPLFPTSTEPYRGNAIYQTVLQLQQLAEVEVFYLQAKYPRWRFLQPRSFSYLPGDPNYSPPGVRLRFIEYPALPVLSRSLGSSFCARSLRPALRDAHPDLILAFWLYPEGSGAVQIGEELGIPVVLGARGSDLLRVTDPAVERKVTGALRRASFVLTVTEAMRQRAIGLGVVPERILAVHNGVDSSIFKPAGRPGARRELGVAPETRLVLFVGHLIPLKGHQELLEAVGRLVPTHADLQLAYIGEGPMEARLRARSGRADLAGHVHFLGIREAPQVARWMAAADLLCLPSHSEGCPNVVLEALSCGRPVVGSAVGGIRELVDSSCGVLVPPGNPERLAQALAEALQRPWDEAAIASRRGRSWRNVAEEIYQVCQAVLDGASLKTPGL